MSKNDKFRKQSHKECQFCLENMNSIYIGNDNTMLLDAHNKKIIIKHYKKKSKIIGMIDIRYCPLCGRDLNEDNQKTF